MEDTPTHTPLTLLTRFPFDTPSSLEAGAGGAGNLARLQITAQQPEIFLPPPKLGITCQLTASHLLGLLWKPNLEGKEGGHRGGGQLPKELTAWAPLSQDKGGTGGRPACAVPLSFSAPRKPPI